jgi:iron complex outermembrane receptor protein
LARGAFYFEQRSVNRFNAATDNRHGVGGLLWRPAANTSLTFDYEYIWQRNDGHRLRGVPVDASGGFLTDVRWTSTEPTDYTDLEAQVVQAHWDQFLSRGIRLDTTIRALTYDRSEAYHEPRGLTAGGTLMQRDFRDQLRTNDDWTAASSLTAPFTTGRVRHEVATGVEIVHQDHLFRSATLPQLSAGGPVPPLSLNAPVYGRTPAYTIPESRFGTDLADSTRAGLYVQDLMALGDRWRVLAGTRVDRYDDGGLDRTGLPLDNEQGATTGRVGLVYKPATPLSIYANVANGFTRASVLAQTPSANGPHPPERSVQVEGGAKADLFAGRAQVTLALFDTVKRNVLRPDPAFGPDGTNPNALLSTGRVRNRGAEVDVAGQLASRWHLAFNYAYLRSRIEDDPTPGVVGRPMPNVAQHMAGLFTRVDLPFGTSLAGSIECRDRREEPFANLIAPAYTVVDLHVFQQVTPHIRVQVRADNVFDEQYSAFSLFAARVGNVPGAPRTLSVLLTLTRRPTRSTP